MNIRNHLPKLDKLQHFFVATLIAFMLKMILKLFPLYWDIPLFIICAVGASFGAEYYQYKFNKGVYDKIDAYYSIAPFIIIGLIDYI